MVVSLLYVGVVRCVIRLKYITVAAGTLLRPVSIRIYGYLVWIRKTN